jgi:IPT/TIG domain
MRGLYQTSRPRRNPTACPSGFGWPTVLLSVYLQIALAAQVAPPEIVGISPSAGPEGTRVEVRGRNLQEASTVLFGTAHAVFQALSSEKLIVLVPHRVSTANITIVTPAGTAASRFPFAVVNDPRIPDEVGYKSGYVNPVPRPSGFTSARLWGIAIADARVPGHESAQVEIAWTQLSCRVDGKDVILNDDPSTVNGGLYLRNPWFGGHDYHEPLPTTYDLPRHAVVLHVGQRTDRVWHFWSPSPRAPLPSGHLEGCTAEARVKISPGALLQMGFDYWRSPTAIYGPGGNNHEAGASNWYFPSDQWQEATFSDIGGVQF